ncbi:serine hydrolase domain-containing protein [Sphingopyxis sp. R3-92]|uniref:serine hydrolase domain-containing protein n=1 Tax=Sphingopyxis sp. R3-92 TaxID=3158553 RepID=UPI003EE63FB7
MSRQPSNIVDAYAGKLFPNEQFATFSASEKSFPTRTVSRGTGVVADLRYAATMLPDLPIVTDRESCDLIDYVSRNRLVGLTIVKDGAVVHERYEGGLGPDMRWISMSMAKSAATTLIGAAIVDGHIGGVNDPLTDYLPALRGSGYDGVSIRHLMRMTSGVEWDDTHTNPQSHRRHMLDLQVGGQHGAIMDYMATLPRIAEPGSVWNYSTGETHVVGALVKAATGKWLADYLSEKIWSRVGMQADACWWLEAPDGLEVAGSGLCATMRDYVRFGLFALNGGVAGGEQVVPEGWFADASGAHDSDDAFNYGYMWWPVPDRSGSFRDGAYSARGIFGQYIYINPARSLLVTVLSSRAKPKYSEAILDNDFFNAVVGAIG